MNRRRWIALAVVSLVFGQLATWGLNHWGMFGFLPGLLIGGLLVLKIIPSPPCLEA
ncbi:hypothetical protein NG726_17735 [Pseudomonas sp. MOB-449]|nr:hypothetical protein [Pseudomonas sp. MOB-449]